MISCINQIFPQTNQTLKHFKITFDDASEMDSSEYNKVIKKILLFLKGKSREVRDGIEKKMNLASKKGLLGALFACPTFVLSGTLIFKGSKMKNRIHHIKIYIKT